MTRVRSSRAGSASGTTSTPGRCPTSPTGATEAYVLEMLPYPSGEPHIGHLKNYSVGDAVAHFRRRHGHARAASDGLRRLRPAGREPRDQHRPAPARVDRTPPSPPSSASSASGGSRSTGRASSAPTSRATTAGRSGSSCKLFERGLAYRKRGGGQLVPQRPDRARQRAGHRRALRALRHLGRGRASSSSGSSGSPTTPTACSTTSTRSSGPTHVKTMQRNWIGRSEGAEVTFRNEELGIDYPVFTTRPGHALRRDVLRHGARAPRRLPARRGHRAGAGGPRVRQPRADRGQRGARRRRPREDRRVPGPPRHQPGQRRAPAHVRGRLRAHGVRDRRDHGRPRPRRARPRVRAQVRPAHPRGRRRRRGRPGRGLHGRRPARQLQPRLRRPAQPRGARAHRGLARPRGQGPRVGQLPPARLAALAPALLGLPDPDHPLRALRHRPGARGRAPGPAARRRRLRAQGALAAGRGRGLGQRGLPLLRRPGAARDRHHGHLRRLVLVLHALHGRRQRRGAVGPRRAGALDAGRPVHRRRRARDPAPDVRALLHEGARRPRLPELPGAVRPALHPGHDHARRREDVQVARQRHLAADLHRALRGRHRARLHPLHRAARPGRRLVRRRRRGRAPLPRAPVAHERRDRRPDAGSTRSPTSSPRPTRSCCARRTGPSRRSPTTWPAASPSTRPSRPSWS